MDDQFSFTHGASVGVPASRHDEEVMLQPINLRLTRPMRAWERKPISPFRSRKSRAKKIWKRATSVAKALNVNTSDMAGLPPNDDFADNAKAIKRRCISSIEAINTQWEAMESPVKRITTRSSASKELIALEESTADNDSHDEDVEGTVTEIIHDDGTTTDITASTEEDQDAWFDAPEEDRPTHGLMTRPEQQITTTISHGLEKIRQETTSHETTKGLPSSTVSDISSVRYSLPIEFATPIRRRRVINRTGTRSSTSRRKTLPHAFAPTLLHSTEDSTNTEHSALSERAIESLRSLQSIEPEAITLAIPAVPTDTHTADCDREKISEQSTKTVEETQIVAPEHNSEDPFVSIERISTPERSTLFVPEGFEYSTPTRNTLRRSPRRPQSASPMKTNQVTRVILPSQMHLIAFSPARSMRMKARGMPMIVATQPVKNQTTVAPAIAQADPVNNSVDTAVDSLPASLSPSPGDKSIDIVPQTPPAAPKTQAEVKRDPSTRLSDDTALLQAFLDRAAKNKTTPVVYAEDAESDSPRVIPASPAAPNILGDLDPNTTSTRGLLSPRHVRKPVKAQVEIVESAIESSEDEEYVRSSTILQKPLRPSDFRRSERIQTTAPARITLRGLQENRPIRRTPAQELFLQTARNTRSNKANAIMPAQRLPQLMAEMFEFSGTQPVIKKSTKRKSVAWNKTIKYLILEEIDENSEILEQVKLEAEATETAESEVEPHKPTLARQATPSKPRVQRLKAPSAPSNIPSMQTSSSKEGVSVPKTKTFKSGIVAPSKRVAPSVKASSQPSKIAEPGAHRKPLQSRLPAPVTAVNTTVPRVSPPTETGQTLMMSPPKRQASLFVPTLEPTSSKAAEDSTAQQAVGLSSPAKKPRKAFVFGEQPGSKISDIGHRIERPMLSSPAKKKVRRLIN